MKIEARRPRKNRTEPNANRGESSARAPGRWGRHRLRRRVSPSAGLFPGEPRGVRRRKTGRRARRRRRPDVSDNQIHRDAGGVPRPSALRKSTGGIAPSPDRGAKGGAEKRSASRKMNRGTSPDHILHRGEGRRAQLGIPRSDKRGDVRVADINVAGWQARRPSPERRSRRRHRRRGAHRCAKSPRMPTSSRFRTLARWQGGGLSVSAAGTGGDAPRPSPGNGHHLHPGGGPYQPTRDTKNRPKQGAVW